MNVLRFPAKLSRPFVFGLGLFATAVGAAESSPVGMIPTPQDAKNVVRTPSYSPYAGRNFPTEVYWGDSHVHTDNSLDAKGFGANVKLDGAYKFARGEEVMSNTGIPRTAMSSTGETVMRPAR